jgi:hypothetical protein
MDAPMSRIRRPHARWAEPLALALLGITLLVRYPIHFILEPPFLMDFEVYRAAAVRLLHGQGPQLYAPTTNEMMVFKYAPIWAAAWLPLGRLSTHAGGVLWTAIGVGCLIVTLILSSRLCHRLDLPVSPLLPVVAVVLLTRPLAQEMGNGQANLLWGCLTVGALAALTPPRGAGLAAGRLWGAASALAAATLLKLPTLLFLLYFSLQRAWRLVWRLLLALAGATLLGCLLVAPRNPLALLQAWASALMTSGTSYAFMIGNQSLLAFLARFLTDDGYGLNLIALPRHAVTWLLAIVGPALLLCLGWPASRQRRSTERLVYDSAILMIMMTIFSPSCWAATYVTLLFPIFLACASLWRRISQRRADPASVALSMGVAVASLFTHQKAWKLLGVGPWRGEAYLFLVFMVLPWLALALMGLLWRQDLQQPGPRWDPPPHGRRGSHRFPPQPA